jgi:hypothetical protein
LRQLAKSFPPQITNVFHPSGFRCSGEQSATERESLQTQKPRGRNRPSSLNAKKQE